MPRLPSLVVWNGWNSFLDVVRKAEAAVQHADAHLASLDGSRELQPAVPERTGRHRVARIHDQVEQHLLKLDAIRHGQRQVSGEDPRDGDAALDQIAGGEAEQFLDAVVHAHRQERAPRRGAAGCAAAR
jgi:hypothetical protein